MMLSNHFILFCPLLFLSSFLISRSIPVSYIFASGGQSIGASASASVLPMNIQDWFPLGSTGLISLQSKGLSRVKDCFFSNCYFLEIFWPCCMVCRILVPKPGIEPMPLHWQHKFLTTGPSGKSLRQLSLMVCSGWINLAEGCILTPKRIFKTKYSFCRVCDRVSLLSA